MKAYHGEDIFLTEALTIEALKAMEEAREINKPFFLYMAHYAVHSPLEADNRFTDNYQNIQLPEAEIKYATMIEGMDESLGDIMEYLEEKKIEKNTIILFTSDNGGVSHAIRGGERFTHNKPLSSGKGSAHEGGIREPMIVFWPGVTRAGSTTEFPVIIEDFYPSVLEMAGIERYETVQTVDGQSFCSILREKTIDSKRPLFWHHPNHWGPSGPGIGASSSIRYQDYKLIYYHSNQQFELFNIPEDIGETTNLADSMPELVHELAVMLADYLREVDAQMPVIRETQEAVPWPDEILP